MNVDCLVIGLYNMKWRGKIEVPMIGIVTSSSTYEVRVIIATSDRIMEKIMLRRNDNRGEAH